MAMPRARKVSKWTQVLRPKVPWSSIVQSVSLLHQGQELDWQVPSLIGCGWKWGTGSGHICMSV